MVHRQRNVVARNERAWDIANVTGSSHCHNPLINTIFTSNKKIHTQSQQRLIQNKQK